MRVSPINSNYTNYSNFSRNIRKCADTPQPVESTQEINFRGKAFATIGGLVGAFIGAMVAGPAGAAAGAAIGGVAGGATSDKGEWTEDERAEHTRYY